MDSREGDRSSLDQLAEAFVARCRTGERPSVDEYAKAHPDLADRILELFPALLLMESTASEIQASQSVRFEGLDIIAEIAPGLGGMGMVFKARDQSLDRIVAVKTTKEHLLTEEGRAFFEREARSAAALDHSNIVRIFSFNPNHAPPYYVMQFVEGRRLDEACAGRNQRFVAAVCEKAAQALEYAHGHGVVHRDIKPSNILVDADGEPHITDFGLAKRADGTSVTARFDTSSIRGTPTYIAPEQYTNAQQPGPAVDIYALGVTLYTVLCRRPPFTGANLAELREDVLHGTPPLPQVLNPDIAEPLQRICLLAIDRDPEHRYASAGEMAEDLRRFRLGREVLARPRRYKQEVRGGLLGHIAEIRLWQERQLIETSDMDRLLRPYGSLLEESPAEGFSKRFPWETLCLRLGGWLVLLSSILWPAFYWRQIEGTAERVAAIGVPTLLLNLVGWLHHWRGSRLNATSFLSTGALLFPLFIAVLLREYGLLLHDQGPERELFGRIADNPDFALTNLQITVSFAAFLFYSALSLVFLRSRIFVAWVGAGTYLTYSGVLLLAGLREWMDNDNVSLGLLSYLIPALSFIVVARIVRHGYEHRWAAFFYGFFPVPLAVILSLLAGFGAEEWFGTRSWLNDPESESSQLWLMANGLVYFMIAMASCRGSVGYTRFWSPFFLALVPVSILVPANVLFEKAPLAIRIGAANITAYEMILMLAGIGFVALGTRMRRTTLTIPGLMGVGVFIFRATDRHFASATSWPLVLAIIGAIAMLVGAAATFWRMRGR